MTAIQKTNDALLRIISAGLFISFLLCYLEWGRTNAGFIFQMEYELFASSKDLENSFSHPLVLLPFAGQLLLLYNTVSPKPHRRLTLYCVILLSLLVLMILLGGLLLLNLKIVGSVLPFLAFTVWFLIRRKDL